MDKRLETIKLPDGTERYAGTRNAFEWPFAEDSIWNMPIGSGAILEPAGFEQEIHVCIDEERIIKGEADAPPVDVLEPTSWEKRWPGVAKVAEMQVPADFYLADAAPPHTPNNCVAFIMPDGRTLKQLAPCCRIETGDAHIVGYPFWDMDIYEDGIGGTHYGSGMSAFGGTIRLGELTSDLPIRHALKINIWGKKYAYFDREAYKGYVWPADRHDSYAGIGLDHSYGGTNPKLRLGTLLCIPQEVTLESLDLATDVAKKIFYALQNYGCYVVDDSAWSCYDFSAEIGTCAQIKELYGFNMNTSNEEDDYHKDVTKLVKSLYIVTNSSPTSIGGGGKPCKPLAPEFEK